MTTVLVHNSAWPREVVARKAHPSKAAVRREHWWNLWRVGQEPFGVIADGVPVLLLDSWPGGGVLSWLVRAHDVHTARLPDKNAAVRAIARWSGESTTWVLGNPYSAARPANSGVVIYWRAEPVSHLGVPKPPQLVVRRNGWLVTDDATLGRWGVALPKALTHEGGVGKRGQAESTAGDGRRGQGRRLDVETRLAIEQRAMDVAAAWCRKQGWTRVTDVSANRAWDLQGVDTTGGVRHVEVKGTTGGPDAVEVTKAEVDWARRHGDSHVLVVVHSIEVVQARNGEIAASGGRATVYDPWRPLKSELVAQRYTWRASAFRRQ